MEIKGRLSGSTLRNEGAARRLGVTAASRSAHACAKDATRRFATTELRDNPLPQRAYPWGDEFAADNANVEMNVGAASTPGCFERGRSPYGCEDLSGNVWEWTRSHYSSYPYRVQDGRENLAAGDDVWRVLRGGSWYLVRVGARCAYRGGLHPAYRYDNCGFRVVLRAAPVR